MCVNVGEREYRRWNTSSKVLDEREDKHVVIMADEEWCSNKYLVDC